jgi:uncharacterized protein (TIGR00303 family)
MSVGTVDPLNMWQEYFSNSGDRVVQFLFFIASTKTSTIPGISIAGANPELTLYTPTLDVEYLVFGMPRTLSVIPVTPDGLPTPALITRAILQLIRAPYMVVNAGVYRSPLVPSIMLPHAVVGGRIDIENALPEGYAEKLFDDAKKLGEMIASEKSLFVVGESMPGGTTTAMAIIEALGYKAIGRVSSSSPKNPVNLKEEVFRRAVKRFGGSIPLSDVFKAVEVFGDPLHISIAGFVAGAIERGAKVLLAGGTQMCSVLAILKRLGIDVRGRVAIGTTRWIAEDRGSDIAGLVRDIAPETPIAYTMLSFGDAPYTGLRLYESGYVKEGVGAGGTTAIAQLRWGLSLDTIKKAIYEEYRRLLGAGYVKRD